MIHAADSTTAHSREGGNPVCQSGSPPSRGRADAERALFRFTTNMLALWGVCANASCRRARACRGDVQDCVARHAPLVPPDAREGMKAMIEGKQDGACFDIVQDHAYDEIEALLNWRATIERANGTRHCARR